MYQCYVYQKGGNIRDAMLSAPALLMIEVPAVNENIEYNRKYAMSTISSLFIQSSHQTFENDSLRRLFHKKLQSFIVILIERKI